MFYCSDEISNRIKSRLQECGSPDHTGPMKMEELALLCGMPRSFIQSIIYLNRRIQEDEAKAIAKHLYVSLEWLLTGIGDIYEAPHIITPTEQLVDNLAKHVFPCFNVSEELIKQMCDTYTNKS